MSALDDLEQSAHGSEPIELYQFPGSYKSYYYTSAAEEIEFNGFTYVPIPDLSRSSVKTGTDSEQNISVKVTMPVTTDLIADYGFQTTPPQLALNIFRIDRNLTPYETNYKTIWSGPVSSINIKGRIVEVDVPSILSSILSSSAPSFYFQNPCNHVLFDPDTCRVSRADNSVNATVTEIQSSGQVLRMSTYGAFTLDEFVGGEILIASQNERRMIIGGDVNTGLLTVNYPFGKVALGIATEFTRGCNHAWKGDCKNRYDNTDRYGGHPLIPPINLFVSGL